MLFSVIVPIYNIEKYLKRCIDSVLAQSFTDYELILVDDGSPDNCPQICDEYAAKDQRIKVIHKENGGLVSARQAGIKIAVGEYVFHLDGDDAICADALKNAYEIIKTHNPDIVSFSYKPCVNGACGDAVYDLADEGLYNKADMAKSIYPNLLSNKNMKSMFYFSWGKAVKRDLATKHQLNVNPTISLGEDLLCSTPCYLDANTVYFSRKVAYLYTVRNDSMTTDFKTSQITKIVDVVNELRNLQVETPTDFDDQISRYSCFICFAILASAAKGGHFSSVKEIKNLIKNSLHYNEIKKAKFENITVKSKIAISLMKKGLIGLAFYFLYICNRIKLIKEG